MPSPLPPDLKPGDKVGHATVLSVARAKLPALAGERKKAADSGEVWGRYVGGDGRTVVLAFSLPPRLLWPNGRPNPFQKARSVKAHRQVAYEAAASAMGTLGIAGGWEKATAAAAFHFPDLRRRDGDGASASLKAYFDGITDSGLWADDSTRHLTHLPATFDVDRDCPRLELTIRRL